MDRALRQQEALALEVRSHEVPSLLQYGAGHLRHQEPQEWKGPQTFPGIPADPAMLCFSAPDWRATLGDLHGLLGRHHDQPPPAEKPEQPARGGHCQDHCQAPGGLPPSIHPCHRLLRDKDTATEGEGLFPSRRKKGEARFLTGSGKVAGSCRSENKTGIGFLSLLLSLSKVNRYEHKRAPTMTVHGFNPSTQEVG